MNKLKSKLLLLLITCSYISIAQPGTIDNTFNIGTGFNNSASVIATQQDGKIIVGGHFISYNGNVAFRI